MMGKEHARVVISYCRRLQTQSRLTHGAEHQDEHQSEDMKGGVVFSTAPLRSTGRLLWHFLSS